MCPRARKGAASATHASHSAFRIPRSAFREGHAPAILWAHEVIPIGVGVTVRDQVTRAHQILVESGFKIEAHAYGTNVEGDMAAILDAVKRIHETLHAEGVVRLSTSIKIGTRTDKDSTLEGKRLSTTPPRDAHPR